MANEDPDEIMLREKEGRGTIEDDDFDVNVGTINKSR